MLTTCGLQTCFCTSLSLKCKPVLIVLLMQMTTASVGIEFCGNHLCAHNKSKFIQQIVIWFRGSHFFGFVGFLAPKNVDLGVEFKALSYLEAAIWTNMYFPAAILKNPRWPPCGYLCKWKHWFSDCLCHLVFKNV